MSSDESITDLTQDHDSGWYDHTNSRRSPWTVYALGNVTVKQGARARTSSLHEVKNLAPGNLRSVGLLLDGNCKVCTSTRCLHTHEYRKTCFISLSFSLPLSLSFSHLTSSEILGIIGLWSCVLSVSLSLSLTHTHTLPLFICMYTYIYIYIYIYILSLPPSLSMSLSLFLSLSLSFSISLDGSLPPSLPPRDPLTQR